MLELICQQRYRVAATPVDLSPYRNHGVAIDTSVAGGRDGSAIHFPSPDSAVIIGLGPYGAWAPLTALKVEVDVRVDPTLARTLTLVDGAGAFTFRIFEHAIEGAVFNADGTVTQLRAGDAFSPDHHMHPVPPDRWVTLALQHDGFARMQLLMDGELVAETPANHNVRGVGAAGVAIGNVIGGGTPFLGDIDEVRIWRLDPRAMRREFLARPLDAATADCWADFIRCVLAWVAAHPDLAPQLLALIQERVDDLVRQQLLLPPAAQIKAMEALSKFFGFWFQGNINNSAAAAALLGWVDVLEAEGVNAPLDTTNAALRDLLGCTVPPDCGLDCDPEMTGFLDRLSDALEGTV